LPGFEVTEYLVTMTYNLEDTWQTGNTPTPTIIPGSAGSGTWSTTTTALSAAWGISQPYLGLLEMANDHVNTGQLSIVAVVDGWQTPPATADWKVVFTVSCLFGCAVTHTEATCENVVSG